MACLAPQRAGASNLHRRVDLVSWQESAQWCYCRPWQGHELLVVPKVLLIAFQVSSWSKWSCCVEWDNSAPSGLHILCPRASKYACKALTKTETGLWELQMHAQHKHESRSKSYLSPLVTITSKWNHLQKVTIVNLLWPQQWCGLGGLEWHSTPSFWRVSVICPYPMTFWN